MVRNLPFLNSKQYERALQVNNQLVGFDAQFAVGDAFVKLAQVNVFLKPALEISIADEFHGRCEL